MSFKMKVECPRCGKIWIVNQGTPEVDCDCHTYCEDGDKEGDCALTAATFPTNLSYPTGLHLGNPDNDDEFNRIKWCSTHNRYSYKVPITIECDWDSWFRSRAPEKFRDTAVAH